MNILKKIPFITLIIFLIVSYVQSKVIELKISGSEIFKRADGSQCISQGGKCINPNSCNGTVRSGLCPGGEDNKCCIPPTPAPSSNTNNGSQCTSQGGKCMNPNSCNGTVKSGLCPGGEDNKCCIPPTPAPSSNTNNGSQCTSQGGKCMNPNSCNGTVKSGLCPGGEDNKCCIPKPSNTTNKPNNTSNGSQCTSQGGQCMNPSTCRGTIKPGLCPGGENNKCCIPKPSNTTNKPNNTSNGSQCTSQGGKCMNPNSCNGTVKSGLCPGGENNKCCIPKPSNTTNKPNNTSNGSQCTSQGGKCMNPNSCNGTVKSGLCPGGENNKCCIPKPSNTTNKPNNTSNGSQCTSQGGQCMNPSTCRGTIKPGLCPGGSNNQCCIKKKTSTVQNNSQCINQGGQCMNPSTCRGTIKPGLCPGGENNKCCIPKPSNTTNKPNNTSNGSQCTSQGGKCMNPNSCNGTVKSGLCPGGENNKCCIPKPSNTTNKPNNTSNGSQCTSQGGQCMNPSTCRGTIKPGLCPGGSNNQCCIKKKTSTVQNNSQCINQGGQCMNPSTCRGTIKPGLCPGGSNNQCCIKKKTSTVQNNSQCTNQGGQCMNPSTCRGTIKPGLCPGGSNNQCCIKKKTSTVQNNSQCTNQGGQCMNPSTCRGTIKPGLCPGGSNVQCCIKKKTNTVKSKDGLSSISNLDDALEHYRGKSGITLPANQNLINEMKSNSSYKSMIKELKKGIKSKITSEAFLNGETIKAEPGSYRGISCLTLGSYKVNIDYSFVPKEGDNKIRIHFWGSDKWDFEWNDSYNLIENIIEEEIPSRIAGDGKPFDITYDFYDEVTITVETVSSTTGALLHYKSKSGDIVTPSDSLYKKMKEDDSYKEMIKDLKKGIKEKITDEKIRKGETISAAPGSYRGLKCMPLGSYLVYIDYSFVPKKGDNKVKLHFWGSNPWDFEYVEDQGLWYNIKNEIIPGMIAGDGKTYDIVYDFYDEVTVTY